MSKKSFADVMASKDNGRRRVSTQVCFSPDLEARYRALEVDLEEALDSEARTRDPESGAAKGRRLGDSSRKSVEIAQEMSDLVDENATAFYDLTFEQQRRHDWLRLRTEHPPRDGRPEDAGAFNAETFGPAAVRLCLIDPEPSDDVFAYLDENLSTGEWERLTMVVWELNEGQRTVPKSRLASSILSGSAAG